MIVDVRNAIASAYGFKIATGKAAIKINEELQTKLTTGNAFMYAVCFLFIAFIVQFTTESYKNVEQLKDCPLNPETEG